MAIINTKHLSVEEIGKVLWDEGLLEPIKAVEEEVSTITVIKDAQGRKGQWTEETRDLNNKLTLKRVDTYAYYDSGEVDTIAQTVTNAQGDHLKDPVTIKHYTDGRPPITQALTP